MSLLNKTKSKTIQEPVGVDVTDIWNGSYGFRPGKSCHQALEQARKYLNEGYHYVVDLDLEKFFDKVNHDYLMHLLSDQIQDKQLLKLIRKYLQSGIMQGGVSESKARRDSPGRSPEPVVIEHLIGQAG